MVREKEVREADIWPIQCCQWNVRGMKAVGYGP